MSTTPGPEARIEQHLRKQVTKNSGVCHKFISTRAGVPDRIVVLAGHTLFVELKAPKGRLRPLQRYQIGKLRQAGADVRVINSIAGVDDLIAELLAAASASWAEVPA